MKILTVCSSPYLSLDPITQLLDEAGLAKGVDSKTQSYQQWHEQVFDAYEQDETGLLIKQALKPGKVWQDMAGQLIHANLGKKQWYWSDSKAGWLLDFWNELESQHRFALIYSPPQIGISQCLLHSLEDVDLESVINSWVNYHLELLRFYHAHQDKCILVNFKQCLNYPSEFIKVCKQLLQIDLDEKVTLSTHYPTNPMQCIEDELFHLLVEEYPQVEQLYQELKSSALSLNGLIKDEPIATKTVEKNYLEAVWKNYKQLQIQQQKRTKKEIKLQERQQDLENKIEQSNQKIKEHETENELLLLQLHQVQEELENQFLKTQDLEKQKTNETQALQDKIKQLEIARTNLEKQTSDEIQVLRENIKQLETVKTSLEKQKADEIQVLQNKIKQLETAKTDLEKQKTNEIQALQNKIEKSNQKIKEHETENELLLLQLHQVQEELEHYFLKYQELEQSIQKNGFIGFIEQKQQTDLPNAQLIQVKPQAESLAIELINLQWQQQTWASYRLEIIREVSIYDQITTHAAIKLPVQAHDLLPLQTWPPQTADENGTYWLINPILLEQELIHSIFYPEDITFLYHFIKQLSQWLSTLEKNNLKNNDWSDYYQALDTLQISLEPIFDLQKSKQINTNF